MGDGREGLMAVDDQAKESSSPLRLPAFRRFLLAHLISATGSAMAPVALAFAVIEQGGGARSLGIVLTAGTVPALVLLLVGGALADRVSRSRILFLGNLGAGAAQGAVAVLVATGTASTAAMSACACASGAAAGSWSRGGCSRPTRWSGCPGTRSRWPDPSSAGSSSP